MFPYCVDHVHTGTTSSCADELKALLSATRLLIRDENMWLWMILFLIH